jgi:hypothetical protein
MHFSPFSGNPAVLAISEVVCHIVLMAAVFPVLIAVDLEGLSAIGTHLGVDRLRIPFLIRPVDLPILTSTLVAAEPLLPPCAMLILCDGLTAISTGLPALDLCWQLFINQDTVAILLLALIPDLLIRNAGIFRDLSIAHPALPEQNRLL